MSEKMSKWLQGEAKPALVGVYKSDYRASKAGDSDLGVVYSYWNGKQWGLYGENPNVALQWAHISSSHQSLPWRGLAEKPEVSK